jgi:cation transport ATPase
MGSSSPRIAMTRTRPPEHTEARFYLRITLVVAVGMVAGALLEWVPADPSPWRWLPLGIAYLVGGARIARDSWTTLRDERKLSIDFLMGAAATGAPPSWARRWRG